MSFSFAFFFPLNNEPSIHWRTNYINLKGREREREIVFLKQDHGIQPCLTWYLLYQPGWPQTHSNPSASVSLVLELQACTITSSFKIKIYSYLKLQIHFSGLFIFKTVSPSVHSAGFELVIFLPWIPDVYHHAWLRNDI